MLTFAIGDIHGCLAPLTGLLDQCRRFADGRPSKFVFLGDYIDRGPDSRDVVQTIMDMQAASPDIIGLCGNHEELLHEADTRDGMAQWLINGGGTTLRSYGVTSPKDIPPEHIFWLLKLSLSHDDGLRFFAHAGIRPGILLDQQTRDDLLWIREPFLSSVVDHRRLIVHGHTPLRSGTPDIRPNRINLDTGAVFGSPLTAAVFNGTQRMPVKILQAVQASANNS